MKAFLIGILSCGLSLNLYASFGFSKADLIMQEYGRAKTTAEFVKALTKKMDPVDAEHTEALLAKSKLPAEKAKLAFENKVFSIVNGFKKSTLDVAQGSEGVFKINGKPVYFSISTSPKIRFKKIQNLLNAKTAMTLFVQPAFAEASLEIGLEQILFNTIVDLYYSETKRPDVKPEGLNDSACNERVNKIYSDLKMWLGKGDNPFMQCTSGQMTVQLRSAEPFEERTTITVKADSVRVNSEVSDSNLIAGNKNFKASNSKCTDMVYAKKSNNFGLSWTDAGRFEDTCSPQGEGPSKLLFERFKALHESSIVGFCSQLNDPCVVAFNKAWSSFNPNAKGVIKDAPTSTQPGKGISDKK